MFKLFIKMTWRNLKKNKFFSIVHIASLGIAFMVAIILFLSARFELSFDNFHQHSDRIGLTYFTSYPKKEIQRSETMPSPLAPTLKKDMPSIEAASRLSNGSLVIKIGDNEIGLTTKYVDEDIFKILNYPALNGEKKILNDLHQIVLTEKAANKLFGSTDCVGKTIETMTSQGTLQKIISAVIPTPPQNSSFQFESLQRFENLPYYQQNNENWSHSNNNVLILFKDKSSLATFDTQSQAFIKTYFKENIDQLKRDGAGTDSHGNVLSLHVLPLSKVHLNDINIGDGINPMYPWILILLTFLILFIACSNFVNLSLASYFNRSLEIAIKKSLGNSSKKIIIQLWGETFVIALVALLIGAICAHLLIPVFNRNTQYQLSILNLFTIENIAYTLGFFFLISLIAGGYPAWQIAKINTVKVLKGKFKNQQGNRTKQILTIFQFSIATVLIIATLIMHKQLQYIHTMPLGFNKEEVVSIPTGSQINGETALKRMRAALSNQPDISSITGTDINIGRGADGSTSTSIIGFTDNNVQYSTNWLRVDYDYFKTLDIQFVAGRDFSQSFGTDTSAVVINETMAKQMGGIDKILNNTLPIGSEGGMRVIGVVKDFHFKDVKQKIDPLTMFVSSANGFQVQYIFARIKTTNASNTISKIEKAWKDINPKAGSYLTFLNENVNNQYKSEQSISNIISAASILAILVSSMGLFGLILISTQTRIKEIGIRKVLGATVPNILYTISKEYILLIGIALGIALPIAWFACNYWLDNFVYRTDMGLSTLLFGTAIILTISGVTIVFQAWRAANINPVDSLRDE